MDDRTLDIRTMTAADAATWMALRHRLWPHTSTVTHEHEIAALLTGGDGVGYLAQRPNGDAAGFAEVSIRRYANGCTASPVPFLEGIWVEPGQRRQGVGRALVTAIGRDLATRGFTELCSDAALDNLSSHAAHAGWGFAETQRVVYFRRPLG